jgi:AcrR family transcriptional regulator
MANRIISDDLFLERALELFRTYGFQGVSVAMLAKATGLEKASLYYRFPGGKDEIALAVVTGSVAWIEANVFAPLQAAAPRRKRIAAVQDNLRSYYGDGTKACVLEMLSIPGGSQAVADLLKNALEAWIDAFASFARESGMAAPVARSQARDALVRIEGSLILARVLGDPTHFQRVLKLLPEILEAA